MGNLSSKETVEHFGAGLRHRAELPLSSNKTSGDGEKRPNNKSSNQGKENSSRYNKEIRCCKLGVKISSVSFITMCVI